jgi:hypothetical protein
MSLHKKKENQDMKIIASLNGIPLATAALRDHGLLTANVLSLRRNPARQLAARDENLLVPELRFRLGGVRQSEEGDTGFTVIECPLATGDRLELVLRPESGESEAILVPPREIILPAEAPRLEIGVAGRQSLLVGQPGYGMISALLIWARRHPARTRGGELPAHQLQLQLAAQDSNAPDLTVQHHWHNPALSPVDVISIGLLPAGEFAAPTESREHWH